MPEPLPTGHHRAMAHPSACVCGETTLPRDAVPLDFHWRASYVCPGCSGAWIVDIEEQPTLEDA